MAMEDGHIWVIISVIYIRMYKLRLYMQVITKTYKLIGYACPS